MSKEILSLDEMTDRESFAAGRLAEIFYDAGILYDASPERNTISEHVLTDLGYSGEEIEVILSHINAATETINAPSFDRVTLEKAIKDSIASERHIGQAPSP